MATESTTSPTVEELAAAVLKAQRNHNALWKLTTHGLTDEQQCALILDKQRAVIVLARAENALAEACRKEIA